MIKLNSTYLIYIYILEQCRVEITETAILARVAAMDTPASVLLDSMETTANQVSCRCSISAYILITLFSTTLVQKCQVRVR